MSMDQIPKPHVAIRELSNTSSSSASASNSDMHPKQRSHRDSSPSLSKTSSESTRHSSDAPPSPSRRYGTNGESQNSVSPTAEYARTTAFDPDAPPAYREQDFVGKSSEEVKRMRKRDYAVEISRLMGRQLVRGLNGRS
ncbi:hypothetical protein N0V90_001061 [Kalmusia sp. IMI 367209]|nr:hypothetical protein N0V90_001061 [Kalmusia sp. IMI 367209]